MAQFNAYLCGADKREPLDFYSFPRIIGDFLHPQDMAISSPMYGPTGMVLAIGALGSSPDQVASIVEKLRRPSPFLTSTDAVVLAQMAFSGSSGVKLAEILCRPSASSGAPVSKVKEDIDRHESMVARG